MSEVYTPIGSEDAEQAKWLAEDFDHTIRFDHSAQRWHIWGDNGIWAPDQTEDVQRRGRELAEIRFNRAGLLKTVTEIGQEESARRRKVYRRLLEVGRLESALTALAAMTTYKTDGSDWDQDPNLLGCKNGVVDLRTGTLIEPDQTNYVSLSTNVVYNPDAQCPRFMQFLDEVTPIGTSDEPDGELGYFFLQWFGYSLFGHTQEQRFLILTGIGRNGKGALTHAIRNVFGEYAANTAAALYMKTPFGAARSDGARADLMALKGKRLAAMSEPEGGQFNEEMLKAHTGGDPITARTLYSRNVISWTPTHSITFLTNKPPAVDDIGPSMAARVMVADFQQRFTDEKDDKGLYAKLEVEAPGILALLVRMAVHWYQSMGNGYGGIVIPPRIKRASEAYLNQSDPIGRALSEAFVIEVGVKTAGRTLYETYAEWHAQSDDANEPLTSIAFFEALHRRGYQKRKTAKANVYLSIRPKNAGELAEATDGD